jgi:hypothetical protein
MSSWKYLRPAWLGVVIAAAALILVIGSGTAEADLGLDAAEATITVDGDNSDWASITGVSVTLKQFEIPPGSDWDAPGEVDPKDATVKVATDDDNIYVLLEIPDDYDYDPADHGFSSAVAVEFLIDPAAGPHMGAGDSDFEAGLGTVDIWHWELDCAAGVTSGGGDPGSGDDPDCNLDDEFAFDPESREDDGDGDTANAAAENSLAGSWSHTNSAGGTGADGTWIFEFSRPLQTSDPEDAAFAAGGTAKMAVAYWDADEGLEGWTDNGHVTSADSGWIVVSLPGTAQQETPTPASVPDTGGQPASDGGSTLTSLALLLALGIAAVAVGIASVYVGARTFHMRRRDM